MKAGAPANIYPEQLMIYFDNAATTLKKPPCVKEAVLQAMDTFGNSGRSAHRGALDASRVIYETREKLAALFSLDDPDRLVFTSNATEALNIALYGLLGAGDHVISTDCEHNSVLRPLYSLTETEKTFLAADTKGELRYEDFESAIRPETRAIVCTHASNLTGNMLDIQRIGEVAHRHGLLFIVDASQTAGAFPIDMEKMHIDVLCFTGHKSLMGPQGTGGLAIARGVEIRPFKRGGTGVQTYLPEQPPQYPTRLEAGTLNGHGIAGLGASVGWLLREGIDTVRAKEAALRERFLEGVCAVEGVTVYGDLSAAEHAPIVSLNIRAYDSGRVSDCLFEDYGIATRSGAHCAPRLHRALGTEAQGAVRFSFGYFNTKEEIDAAVAAVREIAE